MASLDQPVIGIYNRDGAFLDWLRAPISARITPRWLEAGDAELVVQAGDYRADLLRQPGARVKIDLRGEHVLGGPVTRWGVKGPKDRAWTFTITDDAAILDRMLCLPDPTKPLDQQPPAALSYAGRLESVVKQLVNVNAPHLGVDVSIVADQGRGENVTLPARWQPVSDVVFPSLRAQGMGVSVVWQPDTRKLRFDVTQGRQYPIQLSVESRTVTDYDLTVTAPVVTRVFMGPEDGTVFTSHTNTAAEAEWGQWLRGAAFKGATTVDEKTTAASEALNDGNSKSGLSVALSETDFVRYGGPNGLRVGDKASLLIGDVEVTDVVRECVIEWRSGQALSVRPAVGAWDASPVFALTSAVRRMAATLRRYTNR